jgi:hypothetical protein
MQIKEFIKELTEITCGMIYFILICIPVAITIYFTAQLFFSTKKFIQWIKN